MVIGSSILLLDSLMAMYSSSFSGSKAFVGADFGLGSSSSSLPSTSLPSIDVSPLRLVAA